MRFFRKLGLFSFALWLAFLFVLNPIFQTSMVVKAVETLSLSEIISISKSNVLEKEPDADLSYIYYVVRIANPDSYNYYAYFGSDDMRVDKSNNKLKITNIKYSCNVYWNRYSSSFSASCTYNSSGTSSSSGGFSEGDELKGFYKTFDDFVIDTEKPVINYQDYYCVYTYSDGTTTDSSNSVKNHEFGGGATRGGGAGRDIDENGKTKPVITDEDTFGDEDKEPDKKYYRVCYDKDTSTWQPHGTIQIVNNTIINNTYIVTDGTVEPATGSDIPPSDDWPEDTPGWIEFLGNLISGLLQGLGDAIGGLGSAIGGIASALGNLVSTLINALMDLIKMLFIPSDNFMSDKLTSMSDTVKTKIPVFNQIEEMEHSIVGMLNGVSALNSEGNGAPSYVMQLPEWLGSGEFELFDFQFFEQYRTLFHAIISFCAWSLYLMRVPDRLANAIEKASK